MDDARTVRAVERRIVLSASMAHGMTHALELTFAALLVRIGMEFDASVALLGIVANAGTVTFGTTALPAGFLTDRFGPRTIIAGCMAASAGFALAVAAAPTLWVLAIALALLGAALGLYHPAGTAMVSTVATRRGMAFATHGIAGNVGVGAIPAVAVGISIASDWRMAYVALALLAAVVALAVWRLAPSQEEAVAAGRRAERALVEEARPQGRARTQPPRQRGWFAGPLVLIYICSIGTGFIYRGSLTFLELHLEEHLGIELFGWSPEAIAGAMASVVLLTAIAGQAGGGWISDRVPLEWAIVPVIALTAPMLMLTAAGGGVWLLVFAIGFVIANFGQQPIINGLIADYAPAGGAGRAFGISFFLVFGLGSIAGTVCGVVADASGTRAAFALLAGVAVAITLVSLALSLGAERRRRGEAHPGLRALPGVRADEAVARGGDGA
jgi:MFS family permease